MIHFQQSEVFSGKRHSSRLTPWVRSVPYDAISFVERDHLCLLCSLFLLVRQLLVRQFVSALLQRYNANSGRTLFCRLVGRLGFM